MKTILLVGRRADQKIGRLLLDFLSGHEKQFLYLTDDGFRVPREGLACIDYLIYDGDDGQSLAAFPKDLVVVKNRVEPRVVTAALTGAADGIAVVDSKNAQALAMLSERGLHTISCGMTGKDTLTYSSVATDEATVCISRSFADLRGHEVGEQDIVMPVPVGEDYYEVLAFCAACAALGLADLL
ncbi:hypothetical protein [Feifania hominis]|uniref:Uncharacterized protein n=1 Tax=Feifania hominis TaxID=2763660 RepID=A0A926HQX9_9FIRM|nr:hypothetical protein [Feifania hominis]MBC8536837.1 hypothetical protein [Feifania hominis]